MKRLLSLCLALPLSILLASPMSTAQAAPRRAKQAPPSAPDAAGVININTAEPDQLRLLPGIGPSKAQRIVAYRTRRKFKHAYEIIRVRGIGRRTFQRLKRFLTVQGPTTLKGKPRRPRRP